MKFTKRQRNKYYRATLHHLINHIFEDVTRTYSICWSLEDVLEKDIKDVSHHLYRTIVSWFPELEKRNPSLHNNQYGSFWYDRSDRDSRIKVLKACIKETNPKPKKK